MLHLLQSPLTLAILPSLLFFPTRIWFNYSIISLWPISLPPVSPLMVEASFADFTQIWTFLVLPHSSTQRVRPTCHPFIIIHRTRLSQWQCRWPWMTIPHYLLCVPILLRSFRFPLPNSLRSQLLSRQGQWPSAQRQHLPHQHCPH